MLSLASHQQLFRLKVCRQRDMERSHQNKSNNSYVAIDMLQTTRYRCETSPRQHSLVQSAACLFLLCSPFLFSEKPKQREETEGEKSVPHSRWKSSVPRENTKTWWKRWLDLIPRFPTNQPPVRSRFIRNFCGKALARGWIVDKARMRADRDKQTK